MNGIKEENWDTLIRFWESCLTPTSNDGIGYKVKYRQPPCLYGDPEQEFLPGLTEVHCKTKGIKVDWTYSAESNL